MAKAFLVNNDFVNEFILLWLVQQNTNQSEQTNQSAFGKQTKPIVTLRGFSYTFI